ncbi:uncharacterized protein EI90DRAFT_3281627 [Cantharellus anzutake]|uniref:uncharacterized protein n=1 Tax=Cantharellus anzutake TaxID=1750568 RepID=UPI001908CD7A|nr:uncharacterized protein EI90DRAFT_3281627 [Cantharellus anzutake]KAF8326536.1 hypothetical protein EI90DRAFT_3281627 [Cantharellus anzutake]
MKQSLINAMAGPSSGKAGLARDQSEINRIIAEASKNSRFFQEAKRKDGMLTEKIGKLLAERDSVMSIMDIRNAESTVDKMISAMEATRDVSKIICHVDLDAFYASVESLDDPSLVGKAFGVSQGVLTTASYEARKYGCRSGMATFVAKKLCPHLIIVPSHFERYAQKSKEVMDVLGKYDPDMCIMGADEAYLTLNDYCDLHNMTPEECVEQMRADVHRETQLTCSAGIAANRMLAKICSDRNKPNGQFTLPRNADDIIKFMHDLPMRKIPGIGRVTERILTSLGINTCGDVCKHRAMLLSMDKHLPGGISYLLNAHLGIGSNIVEPPVREDRKSVGVERTFSPDADKDALLAKLEGIAEDLEEDLARTGWAGRTVTLKYKLDTFQTFTRAKSLSRFITSKADIFAAGKELFLKEFPSISKLRLIGLRLTMLKDLRLHEVSSPNFKKRKRLSDGSGAEPTNHGFAAEATLASNFEADTSAMEDDCIGWELGNAPEGPSRWDRRKREEEALLFSKTGGTQLISHTNPGADAATERPLMLNSIGDSDIAEGNEPISLTRLRDAVRGNYDGGLAKFQPSTTAQPQALTSPNARNKRNRTQTVDHSEAPRSPLQCPICSKELVVDNDELNAHIDYCLSRGTIMEAASGR